jgi:predicted  nucleic acid-binding Zn-ribbon protein
MTPAKIKFLIALGSAIRNGAVKTIRQAMNFAEQQFGKIDKSFVDDIVNVFKKQGKTKKGEVVPIKKKVDLSKYDDEALNRLVDEDIMLRGEADTLSDFGKDYGRVKEIEKRRKEIREILEAAQKNPELVGIKKGLSEADKDIADIQKSMDDLDAAEAEADAFSALDKRTRDIAKGDVTGEASDLMTDLDNKMTGIKKAADEMKEIADKTPESFVDFFYAGTKARDPRQGVVRAAAREILNKNKVNIGREDPINIFRQMYGEDGLEAVDAVSDSLLEAQTYGEMILFLKKLMAMMKVL